MSTAPRISVLLPVYNGTRYLAESIDSILAQTRPDFELLIVNDGSKDDSAAVIARYRDPRIRYFEQENAGLPAALNVAAGHARGAYFFRQDQDDISRSTRFEHQMTFLEAHPEVGLLGSWARIFRDGESGWSRFHKHPTSSAAIAFNLLFDTPFVHSAVAIRREAFESIGGYSTDRERQPPEDYELWSRLSRVWRCANLPEVLLDYREVPGSMSRTMQALFSEHMLHISRENIEYWLKGSECCSIAGELARLYREVEGCTPEGVGYGQIRSILDLIVGRIELAHGKGDNTELAACRREVLWRLRRNYGLGRGAGKWSKLLMRAGFKLLRP